MDAHARRASCMNDLGDVVRVCNFCFLSNIMDMFGRNGTGMIIVGERTCPIFVAACDSLPQGVSADIDATGVCGK